MSSEVIYRKYRPSTFAELIGQNLIKDVLVNSVANTNFSQAYLFTGPRGTGKTTSARLFAKAINCTNFSKNNDVCNECSNCLTISETETPDIIEMDAASNRGIEDIRSLKESVNFVPSSLKFKVYIIDEAHMLTKEAFNALLKTLEEPPQHVVFILATTEPHKVPITILSRLQRFDFKLSNKDNLTSKLSNIAKKEKIKIEEDALELLHKLSGGSFRDAESILSKAISYSDNITSTLLSEVLGTPSNQIVEEFINKSTDQSEIFAYIDQLKDEGINLELLIEDVIETLVQKQDQEDLIKTLYEFMQDYGKFNDKHLFLKAKIAFYIHSLNKVVHTQNANTGVKVSNVTTQSNSKQTLSESNNVNKSTKINKLEKTVNINKTKRTSNDPFNIEEYVALLNSENPRLSSIVKYSKIDVENNSLVIRNNFTFNIKYLDSNIDLLSSKLKQINNKLRIILKKLEDSSAETDHFKYSNTSSSEPGHGIVEDKSVEAVPEIKEEEKEKGKDNTKLVESIL